VSLFAGSETMDEKDSDEDKEFDDLCRHLPQVSPKNTYFPRKLKRFQGNDDFQQWLIGRYDRASHERVGELISASFWFISNVLLRCSLIYLCLLLVGAFLFVNGYYNLTILFFTFSSTSAFIVLFAVRKHIPIHAFLPNLISTPGVSLLFLELILHSIHIHTFLIFQRRSSSIFFWVLLTIVWNLIFFFFPCLYFDNVGLRIQKLIWFSVKISLLPGNPANLISAILVYYVMVIVSPFTFGLTFWMAYTHRIILYYRVCGTTSSRPHPEI
jgi:hypothetical protein